MGLTTLLCLALLTGVVALILESVSIATDSWAAAQLRNPGAFRRYLQYNFTRDYTNWEEGENEPPPLYTPRGLLKNKGFWRYCEYRHYTDEELANNVTLTVRPILTPVPAELNFEIKVQCYPVNFSGGRLVIPEPPEEVIRYWTSIYYLDRIASGFACICVGLQLCAVLTSFQAAYTTLPVLFTDCGVMSLFAAFFKLVCMVLFMISMSVEVTERPMDLIPMDNFPQDYSLEYSWSFYLGWGSFIFSLVTGIAYLLLARAWETEEVWLKPMGKEKKGPKL